MRRIFIPLVAGILVAAVACTEAGAQPTVTPSPSTTSTSTATAVVSASPTAPGVVVTATATGVATAPPKAIDPTRTPVATATSGPQPIPTPTPRVTQPVSAAPALDASRRREQAPIHELDVRIAESSPPQVFVDVTTGLPSGCAQFDSAVLERSGSTITLTMWNSQPSGNVACTAIYGYMRQTVPLGAMSPGTYSLRVNSETRTFTVQ